MAAEKKSAQEMDTKFKAAIETGGAFATFLTVPNSADLFGTRKPVKVGGTIDGHPFQATLMPSGDGPHWMPIKAALKKLVGKDKGDEVTVHLQERLS